MPYSLILALGAMVVTLVGTPVVMNLARRSGAVDRPGARRVHAEPVPTLGGLAMIVAVLGVAWVAHTLPGAAQLLDARPLIGLTVATIPVLILGIADDVRGLSPPLKLLLQAVTASVLVWFGYGVPFITSPFGPSIDSGLLNVPLTILWVMVVMNGVNLVDGLDGLAAGVVLIASVTLWWVGRFHGDFYVMFISSLLIGATFGFLRYNFPPARVFMGDTGSHFLGLALAAVSLLDHRKGTTAVTLLLPLVALAFPIADGFLAFLRRLIQRRPVFRGDSEHVHHRLLRLGLSHRTVVLVLWFMCLYFGVMAVVLAALPTSYGTLLALVLAAGLLFAFKVLQFIDHRLSARSSEPRRTENER